MNDILYPFAAAALLAAALAAIAIWSNQKLMLKVCAVAIVGLILPAAYITIADLLSRPKPVTLEWSARNLSEATVLSAQLEEGERIFLWLRLKGIEEPRYFALPWNEQVAKQLYGAQREAKEKGTEVRMKRPAGRKYVESEKMFYAAPQPAAPLKQAPSNSPYYHSSEIRSEDRGV